MKPAVAELLHNPLVWRGDGRARVEHAVASGFAELDRELPGSGWPQGSLTELLVAGGALTQSLLGAAGPRRTGGE